MLIWFVKPFFFFLEILLDLAIVIIFAKLNIFRADNNHLLYGISFYTHRHPNNMMYSFFHWSGCSGGSEGSITYFLLSPKLRVMQVQIPGKGIRWRRRGVWAQSVYSFLVLGCFGGPVPGIRMGSPRLGGVSGATFEGGKEECMHIAAALMHLRSHIFSLHEKLFFRDLLFFC